VDSNLAVFLLLNTGDAVTPRVDELSKRILELALPQKADVTSLRPSCNIRLLPVGLRSIFQKSMTVLWNFFARAEQ
jgi:hypothetical protein